MLLLNFNSFYMTTPINTYPYSSNCSKYSDIEVTLNFLNILFWNQTKPNLPNPRGRPNCCRIVALPRSDRVPKFG